MKHINLSPKNMGEIHIALLIQMEVLKLIALMVMVTNVLDSQIKMDQTCTVNKGSAYLLKILFIQKGYIRSLFCLEG
ncbi:hypothetical protein DOX69_21680 [Cronobacter sakazakii]|nr:hypothetical protein [Cronobacter sakazakii]EGT4286411.1 hypothetical protein [Cronobacter sakazakii]EGT4294894.1 hypothetical protein [Cronobacter sakazakii]PQY37411.1 hypothetical protein C5947_16070 [Cronobacter sakazakii]PUE79429.1 hypothetical protein C3D71_04595 [Cronobacter sakazakii]